MHRWRQALAERKSLGRLVDFHARHKLLLLSRSPKHYRALGQRVAAGKGTPLPALYEAYQTGLLEALQVKTAVGKHADVLRHMAGYFKRHLDAAERGELARLVDRYQEELVPLVVPLTLLGHFARKYEVTYLLEQVYLEPHPIELKLRNHV